MKCAKTGEVSFRWKRNGRPARVPLSTERSAPLGFTLIELILVMAILTIAVSLTAPSLSNFFRGRSLESEARRLLALTHQGQSRAVSEGVPMSLWIDAAQGAFGLEAEASFEPNDPKAVEIKLDKDMQVAPVNVGAQTSPINPLASSGSAAPVPASNHPNLPAIRFLPDGSFSDTSPQAVCLTGRDGASLWLVQGRTHLNYEIRNRIN